MIFGALFLRIVFLDPQPNIRKVVLTPHIKITENLNSNCTHVFAYANCWFSHDAAHIYILNDSFFIEPVHEKTNSMYRRKKTKKNKTKQKKTRRRSAVQ